MPCGHRDLNETELVAPARSATLSLAGDDQPVSVLEADVLAIASLTIPWTQLGLAGLLAGLLPARRAVRLNVLNALHTA